MDYISAFYITFVFMVLIGFLWFCFDRKEPYNTRHRTR